MSELMKIAAIASFTVICLAMVECVASDSDNMRYALCINDDKPLEICENYLR